MAPIAEAFSFTLAFAWKLVCVVLLILQLFVAAFAFAFSFGTILAVRLLKLEWCTAEFAKLWWVFDIKWRERNGSPNFAIKVFAETNWTVVQHGHHDYRFGLVDSRRLELVMFGNSSPPANQTNPTEGDHKGAPSQKRKVSLEPKYIYIYIYILIYIYIYV